MDGHSPKHDTTGNDPFPYNNHKKKYIEWALLRYNAKNDRGETSSRNKAWTRAFIQARQKSMRSRSLQELV